MTPEQTMVLLGKSAQNFGIASWLYSIQVAIPRTCLQTIRLTYMKKVTDIHGPNTHLNTTYVAFRFEETFRYFITSFGR